MNFISLIFLLFVPEMSKQQHSISWIERSDHVYNSCRQKYILEKVNIYLYSRISLGSQKNDINIAKYEIQMRGSNYKELCLLDLTKCVGLTNSKCYCNAKSEQHLFEVTIILNSSISLSEATVRGTIHIGDTTIYSDEIVLPEVYGVSKSDIDTYINGKLMNNDQCEATFSGQIVAVLLKPSEKSYLPLTLSAMDNKTGKFLKNETDILHFVTGVKSQATMKLNYEILTVPHSRHSFVCKIKAVNRCGDVQRTRDIFVGLFISAFSVITIVLIIGCIKANFNLKQYTFQCEKQQKWTIKRKENLSDTLEFNKKEDISCNVRDTSSGNYAPVSIMPTDIVNLTTTIKTEIGTRSQQYKDSFRKIIQFQLNTMVKLKINKTSNRRPKHWPGETIPYSYYSRAGCDTERLGVGRIVSVKLMNQDNKERSLVWRSQYPKFNKTEWIEIMVYTSRHVVFDDIEAKHTTCSFLINHYDNDDAESKRATNSPIIKISGNIKCRFQCEIVNMANVNDDWILLTFTTDDVSCFQELNMNLCDYNEKRKRIIQNAGLYKDIQNMGIVVQFPMKQTEQIKQMKNDLKQTYNYLKCYLQQSKDNFKPTDYHLKQTDDYLNQIKDTLKQVQDSLKQTLDYLKQSKDNLNLIKPTEDHLSLFKPTGDHLNFTKPTEDHLNLIRPTEDHLKHSQDYYKLTQKYLKRRDDRLIHADNDHTNIYLEQTKDYLKRTKNFLKRTRYTAKQTDFYDLLKIYLEPDERKKLSHTLNTYFPIQKTAIYFEIQNEYYMKRDQTEIKEEQYVQKDKHFNSFPIVLKFSKEFIG